VKSKQLSIISKRPSRSDFTFFLDAQTDSDDLHRVLTDAGLKVVLHRQKFQRDEADDVWISSVASEAWITVSGDKRMERDPVILAAICRFRAKVVLLTDNNSGYPQWAAALISYHNAIVRHMLSSDGPLIVRLSRGGISKVRLPVEVQASRRQAETEKIVRSKRGK